MPFGILSKCKDRLVISGTFLMHSFDFISMFGDKKIQLFLLWLDWDV
jgi:hypothetical protein